MAWTKDQSRIIAAKADDLLISAAAGSGKTYTMTHRIVERVKARELSMDKVLVLTFTDKAANNMRIRMAQVLHEAVDAAEGQAKQYLLEQEMRLSQAQISTIHSFASTILREHGAQISATRSIVMPDAAASVMETEEQERLLAEAIDMSLNKAYAEADMAFLSGESGEDSGSDALVWQLNDIYGRNQDDDPLRTLLAKTYGFLRSMPDYVDWVRQALADYRRSYEDFSSSPACHYYMDRLAPILERAMQGVTQILPYLLEHDPPHFKVMHKYNAKTYQDNDAIRQAFLHLIKQIQTLHDVFHAAKGRPDWDEVFTLGQAMEMPKLSKTKNDAPEKAEIMYVSRAYLAELLHFLNGSCATKTYSIFYQLDEKPTFTLDQATITEELAAQDARTHAFFELLLEADVYYAELKTNAKLLDFSDLEQFALALVRVPEVKAYYRNKFSEIYIDEYQDTSSIQDAIISELSHKNLFVVGDIKQSIYRFRHANPRLFAERYQAMKSKASENLFELSINFRSTPAVLRSINQIFHELMTVEASDIDYRAGHALGIPEDKQRAEEAVLDEAATECEGKAAFNILTYHDSRENLDLTGRNVLLSKHSAESLAIADEIIKLLESGVAAESIAVLSRNHKDLAYLAASLASLGIEYSYSKEERILESLILRTVIALLRIIENPLQDNYLVTVLLHLQAWAKFSIYDLIEIKRHAISEQSERVLESAFHEALLIYQINGQNEELRSRLSAFFAAFSEFRQQCLSLDIDRILLHIYEDLGVKERAAGERDASAKIKQLDEFSAWAGAFVKAGQNSLYAVNKELAVKDDKITLTTVEEHEELHGVQLMTFHHSKGLEFPYVFISNADLKFKNEAMSPLAYSQSFGLGPEIADDGVFTKRHSIVQSYINARESAASQAEHLRLIYVALTRAEQKIYLCVSDKTMHAALDFVNTEGEALQEEALLPAWAIRKSAKESIAALVLLGISRQKNLNWPLLSQTIAQRMDEALAVTEAEEVDANAQTASARNDLYFSDYALLLRDSAAILKEKTQPALLTTVSAQQSLDSADEPLLKIFLEEAVKEESGQAFWQKPYLFPAATQHGIKYSVSVIKDKAYQDALSYDESQDGLSQTSTIRDATRVMRPLADLDLHIDASSSLNAAERGSLQHQILRYLRPADFLGKTPLEATEQLHKEIDFYAEQGLFTDFEAEYVKSISPSLLAFLNSTYASDIARCDLAEADSVIYREIPFTLAWSAQDLLKEEGFSPNDKVLVQGIVDLWYQVDGRTLILDFKSDQIQGDEQRVVAELKKRYATQLEIYSIAVERESGRQVDEKLIWLLSRNKAFSLD